MLTSQQKEWARLAARKRQRARANKPPEGFKFQKNEQGLYVLDVNGRRVLVPVE